jgi:hypothetical protein
MSNVMHLALSTIRLALRALGIPSCMSQRTAYFRYIPRLTLLSNIHTHRP